MLINEYLPEDVIYNNAIYVDNSNLYSECDQSSAGLDGNKLAQVWNIARRFCLSPFRRLVNFTLDRTFLRVQCKFALV